MGVLALPANSDAAGKLVVLLENIESQIADTDDYAITVDEDTATPTLAAATAEAVVTTTPTESAYGFTLAQAEALIASVNDLVTDVEALRQLNATLVNALAAVGAVTIAS